LEQVVVGALEAVEFFEDREGDDDIVLFEDEEGVGVVEEDVGVDDEALDGLRGAAGAGAVGGGRGLLVRLFGWRRGRRSGGWSARLALGDHDGALGGSGLGLGVLGGVNAREFVGQGRSSRGGVGCRAVALHVRSLSAE
jgi:hypothetical protein